MIAEDEEEQWYLKCYESSQGKQFRIEMLIQSACKKPHQDDSQVDDTAKHPQLSLIQIEMLL